MVRSWRDIALASGAILLAAAGLLSYRHPLAWECAVTPGDWIVVHVFDGLGRVFWFDSPDENIRVSHQHRRRRSAIEVHLAGAGPLPAAPVAQVRVGTRRQVSAIGGAWRVQWPTNPGVRLGGGPTVVSFVRLPAWIPAAILVVPPAIGLVRGPFCERRRRRRGLCLHCGYDLTALIEPRCPECGTPIASGK